MSGLHEGIDGRLYATDGSGPITDPPGEPDHEMARLTRDFVPVLPKAYEKSVVLGGGRVLFPLNDPKGIETVLREHIKEVARRAYKAGRRDAKAEIRGVLHSA